MNIGKNKQQLHCLSKNFDLFRIFYYLFKKIYPSTFLISFYLCLFFWLKKNHFIFCYFTILALHLFFFFFFFFLQVMDLKAQNQFYTFYSRNERILIIQWHFYRYATDLDSIFGEGFCRMSLTSKSNLSHDLYSLCINVWHNKTELVSGRICISINVIILLIHTILKEQIFYIS